jgi:hypothetical protein
MQRIHLFQMTLKGVKIGFQEMQRQRRKCLENAGQDGIRRVTSLGTSEIRFSPLSALYPLPLIRLPSRVPELLAETMTSILNPASRANAKRLAGGGDITGISCLRKTDTLQLQNFKSFNIKIFKASTSKLQRFKFCPFSLIYYYRIFGDAALTRAVFMCLSESKSTLCSVSDRYLGDLTVERPKARMHKSTLQH